MNETRKISTSDFKIEKNLISFRDSLIQISNISQVDIASPPKKPLNFTSVVAIILGLLIYMGVPGAEIIGLIIAGCGAVYVFWYMYLEKDETIYLNIFLNSGMVYRIICKEKKFLKEVMQVIEYCINNHYAKIVQIDFESCNIVNSPIIPGDNNKVNICQ